MSESEEPETKIKRLPIKDFWKRNRTVGQTTVASGPLPSHDELPPINPEEGQSETESKPNSPQFPGTPRDFVPTKGAKLDD